MRWFTSDLHFGHTNIIKYCSRPFLVDTYSNSFTDPVADVASMDNSICSNINSLVAPTDELWVLGDVALSRLEDSLLFVESLNVTKKFLVPGNHDKCHPLHKKFESSRALYEKSGFEILDVNTSITLVNGLNVQVSHFPFKGDSRDSDRYTKWRPIDDGRWLLSGHVHEKWRQRGKVFNVGIDAWGGFPVSEGELIDLISKGPCDRDIINWVL